MEVIARELTLPVREKRTGRRLEMVDRVVLTITRRKLDEIVRAYRRKAGLHVRGFFEHMEPEPGSIITDGPVRWMNAKGETVKAGFFHDQPAVISIEKSGGFHLFNYIDHQLVRSDSYAVAQLLEDFGLPRDAGEPPPQLLRPGERQGSLALGN